jgi:ATP synthase subunit 6
MMVYSPLEQFEPIPLLTILFGTINLSVTNITIIFIYIVLVLCYFLNGYTVYINESKNIKLLHPRAGTLTVKGVDFYNYLDNFKVNIDLENFLSFYSNKLVSYLGFIYNTYSKLVVIKETKEQWLGLNALSLPVVKTEYSREFHKTLFNSLKKKSISLDSDQKFFNNIQLYINSFLTSLSLRAKILSSTNYSSNFVARNVFHFFMTKKKAFDRLSKERFNTSSVSFLNLPFLRFFDAIYQVALQLVKENIGSNNSISILRFFPFILSLFVFILTANLIGLIPYSSTVTSYLIVTFAMSVTALIGVNVIAGRLHGLTYFGHFLPAGCPFNLYPLIIPIEFISYVFRVVSLSVRLFANMMAGHTLLAVLAGFGWTMANTSVSLCFFHPLPLLVVFVLVFLETAVAIVQAYVFSILTCMYLDEAINLH